MQSTTGVVEMVSANCPLRILFFSTTCTTSEKANAAKFTWLTWGVKEAQVTRPGDSSQETDTHEKGQDLQRSL